MRLRRRGTCVDARLSPQQIDASGDGVVDFDEFATWAAQTQIGRPPQVARAPPRLFGVAGVFGLLTCPCASVGAPFLGQEGSKDSSWYVLSLCLCLRRSLGPRSTGANAPGKGDRQPLGGPVQGCLGGWAIAGDP